MFNATIVRWSLVIGLAVLVTGSGAAAVYVKHENRTLFMKLQSLYEVRNELQQEWGRLLLERSTLIRPKRIERLARERLGMVFPGPADTVIIEL